MPFELDSNGSLDVAQAFIFDAEEHLI